MIVVYALIAVYTCPTWLGAIAIAGDEQRPVVHPKDRVEAMVWRSAVKNATIGFDASLEMRENVDFLLAAASFTQEALANEMGGRVALDAVIELNASLCRTHVVLCARYWVSADGYRAAVVWGEPHAGSLNFPVYPPTLNIVSDPNRFVITHQIQHLYDGVFPKPLGARGPFVHRFNSYTLSDIRFAEQEIVDLCRNVEDEWTDNGENMFSRRRMVLPQRPIAVSFQGRVPTITIAGETRQYSELETVQDEGGREWVVDYAPVRVAGRSVSLPTRITVRSGDGKRILRSARLQNRAGCPATLRGIEEDARRFSGFDASDMGCRELLLKYWMKPSRDVEPTDANVLRELRTHFAGTCASDMSLGERLKRVNTLIQLDWMLGDAAHLRDDFHRYTSLLAENALNRMILFGGQNIIETTVRWEQFDAGDRLLSLWLDAAVSPNDPNSLLDFASANLVRRQFWTTATLMERTLSDVAMSASRRFIARAYRTLALAALYGIVNEPDHNVRTKPDIAQARWVLIHHREESLLAECKTSLDAALEAWAGIAQPTREHRKLRSQLASMENSISASRSPTDERQAERRD